MFITKEEKKFFADTAWGASRLSKCNLKRGAILINGRQIESYGFSKKIIRNKEWEISAIYDAIFGAKGSNMSGFFLFSTHFPSLNDMLLVVSVGISAVYFFGEITDVEVVRFSNSLSEDSISLDMIQLK
jgi:deoxycytidylate deaminase